MIDLAAGGIFSGMFGRYGGPIHDVLLNWMGMQNDELCSYAPHRQNYWRDRYVSMLKELTGFESVALFCEGSVAVEAFLRVAWVYTGRPGLWGGLVDPDEVGTEQPRCDQMHGMTHGSRMLAGQVTWHELGIYPELGATRFGQRPEITACMAMEPYHAPSAQFHKFNPTIKHIMGLRKEFPNILFLMDEIQGGFGRTGKLWAHEHYDNSIDDDGTIIDHPIKPDFITIGKLCGGGLPLSALLGPKDIMESDDVKKHAHLSSTHGGNPLMCAVGCTVIEEMQKQDLIKESARKGEILHEILKGFPVRTHGRGLLAGIVMQDAQETKNVVEKCLERGVQVVDTGRKWVKLGPELTIPDEALIQGIKILQEVVEEVISERQPEACGDSSQEPGGGNPVLQVVPLSGSTPINGSLEGENAQDRQDEGSSGGDDRAN